ncbi:hypothetical protein Bca101_026159 [Brassica carinata]
MAMVVVTRSSGLERLPTRAKVRSYIYLQSWSNGRKQNYSPRKDDHESHHSYCKGDRSGRSGFPNLSVCLSLVSDLAPLAKYGSCALGCVFEATRTLRNPLHQYFLSGNDTLPPKAPEDGDRISLEVDSTIHCSKETPELLAEEFLVATFLPLGSPEVSKRDSNCLSRICHILHFETHTESGLKNRSQIKRRQQALFQALGKTKEEHQKVVMPAITVLMSVNLPAKDRDFEDQEEKRPLIWWRRGSQVDNESFLEFMGTPRYHSLCAYMEDDDMKVLTGLKITALENCFKATSTR